VIEDPDGFVNMRSKPNASSEIVLKIRKDEFFLCEPSESEWWPVKDFFDNKGYMHRSRIRLLKDLPGKDLERLFVNPPIAPEDELVDIHEISKRLGRENKSESLFSNDDLKQCIFITHYTDGMIPTMILFSSKDVPDPLFEDLSSLFDEGLSLDEKKNKLPELLADSLPVPAQHFETVQGLKLGDRIDKAIKIFGEPHNQRKSDKVTIYEWGFPGGLGYGNEYSESSLGFFDLNRVTEDGTSIMRLVLDPDQLKNLEAHMQSSEFANFWVEWGAFDRTRGSRVHLGWGFNARLYVRDGQIVALDLGLGTP
jgi:hypothetical protein